MPTRLQYVQAYGQIFLVGLCVFLGMLFPIVPLHELGHEMVCELTGGEGRITGFNRAVCAGSNNVQLMWFAGGAYGAAGSLVPWLFWNKLKKHLSYLSVVIASSAFAVLEFQKGLWEATDYAFYITRVGEQTFLLIAMISAIIFGALLRNRIALSLKKG